MPNDYKKQIKEIFLEAESKGKIISPQKNSITDTIVHVVGETENITEDQYIWLVVEKPKRGLCWPKSPRIKPNTEFKAVVYEEGRSEPYNLALYAVSETIDNEWFGWLMSRKQKRVSIPPDNKRLDTVELIKGDDMTDKNKELHRLLDQFKDSRTAQEINRILLEIESTKPGGLQKILNQLKAGLA